MTGKRKFPNRIKELRVKRGLSREYMAAMTKISWGHYVRIENGQTDPSATKLRDLAHVLGCRMEELFKQ